jgi:endonuclease/exonuclease/phosphatase family metal-dependent hydrolase
MAEAVALRVRINGLLEGNDRTPLLLLGDFNDVPEAQTSLILNGPPVARSARRGSTGRTRETTPVSSTERG